MGAVDVTIADSRGVRSLKGRITGYNVSEDSTPISGADSSGAIGTMSFNVVEDPSADGTIASHGDVVTLIDAYNGTTTGIVTDISASDGTATITADSRLGLLVALRLAEPYTGTLEGLFRYYLGLASITTGIAVTPAIATIPVTVAGWEGDLWTHMKEMVTAYGCEIALVSNNIVLRPVRQHEASMSREEDSSWSITNDTLAQYVDVVYTSARAVAGEVVWPRTPEDSGQSTHAVEPQEQTTVVINIEGTLTSVMPPSPVDFVPLDWTGNQSIYSVLGKNGYPARASEWVEGGGSITAELNELGDEVTLTIRGAGGPQAPYSIATIGPPATWSGTTLAYGIDNMPVEVEGIDLDLPESFPSLRLAGTGVITTPQTLRLSTSVPPEQAAQEVGVTIQSPFISTIQQAYAAGMPAALEYGAASQEVTVSAIAINQRGETGSAVYPTFYEFDGENAGLLFTDFDNVWSNSTFDNFDIYWYAKVQGDFENQAFGNGAGARLLYRDAYYRLRSARYTDAISNYTGERDTLFSDLDKVWSGSTFATYDARWEGKTYKENTAVPLWRK